MRINTAFWLTPTGLIALAIIAFPTYFLLMEHRDHAIQALPYLILALCPLMHIFMHRGHGKHENNPHQHDGENDGDFQRGYEEGVRDANDHKHNH